MAIPRLREYNGPALLSYGFRPFFLFGSLYAGLSVVLWLPQFYGELQLATLFSPVEWHVHEMFFGYLAAIVTGFLFTAVPNWTGRMPIQGTPLLVLVVLWLCGRFAVTFSAYLGWLPVMIVDLAFLAAIFLVLGNEITAGRNCRNLKVLLPLAILLVANAGFHLEAHFRRVAEVSERLAMTAIVILITIIGGRLIPSFTRNWLARENPGRLPEKFSRFDAIAIVLAAASLALWTVMPVSVVTGVLLGVAAVLHFIRLSRWAGDRTLRDSLVVILHVSYLFIPAGFMLLSCSILFPESVPPLAGIHAFGIGAAGSMTLSVMVRATLGHTGHALKAGRAANFVFGCVVLAAITRILAEFLPELTDALLHASAFLWLFAFAGFGILFGPLLVKPRMAK